MSGTPSEPDTAPDVEFGATWGFSLIALVMFCAKLAAAAPLYYREAVRKQRERRKMLANVDVETHNRTHAPPP